MDSLQRPLQKTFRHVYEQIYYDTTGVSSAIEVDGTPIVPSTMCEKTNTFFAFSPV